ncbi:MAG: hypothetical protein C0518_03625 [Opitutus sp.]|nr:hypothetical protein [Opitutus sp.]
MNRSARFPLGVSVLVLLSFGLLGCIDREAERVEIATLDLAAIADALERFRTAYGDFPRVPVDTLGESDILSSSRLWASLAGWRGDTMSDARLEARQADLTTTLSRVSLAKTEDARSGHRSFPIDPWGNPYRYFYLPHMSRYELYSAGPDGDAIFGNPRDRGLKRDGRAVNEDNIFPPGSREQQP